MPPKAPKHDPLEYVNSAYNKSFFMGQLVQTSSGTRGTIVDGSNHVHILPEGGKRGDVIRSHPNDVAPIPLTPFPPAPPAGESDQATERDTHNHFTPLPSDHD